MGTADLRRHFLVDKPFVPGRVTAVYSHYDRMVILGVMPEGGAALRFGAAFRFAAAFRFGAALRFAAVFFFAAMEPPLRVSDNGGLDGGLPGSHRNNTRADRLRPSPGRRSPRPSLYSFQRRYRRRRTCIGDIAGETFDGQAGYSGQYRPIKTNPHSRRQT